VHVLPNGVDHHRFHPQVEPALPGPTGSFTVGFTGSLKPWHGLLDLMDVFAELHGSDGPARLLVVGEGPMREELEDRATRAGLGPSVILTGAVDAAAVPPMLASMDVAVAPYPALEGFYFSPLKIFEYMAAGRAIVAAAIGQVSDVIDDGATGLLYPPGDVAALLASLLHLRADGPARERLGRAARQVAVRRHGWDSVVARVLALARGRRMEAQGT
jgi:glycosyltransferase involved in cell wall biosynthesis